MVHLMVLVFLQRIGGTVNRVSIGTSGTNAMGETKKYRCNKNICSVFTILIHLMLEQDQSMPVVTQVVEVHRRPT